MGDIEYSLEIEGLSKKLNDFYLQNINLKLPKGYIMGYVGQNGAGKTSTIKLIMEQLKHQMGNIRVNGIEYKDNEILYKDSIGFIADECYYPDEFTLNDIEKAMIAFYPSFQPKQFQTLLQQWSLPYKKKLSNFSKGMKVRAMFATIMARDTKLLILDEATSGLDPVIRSEILELLQEYIASGERSVLFSTHIMSDLEQIADYIFFLDKGVMVFQDTKDEILEKYVIVKGGREELSKQLEEKLIGIKKTKIGFEGIISTEYMDYVNSKLLVEKPTIDKIIIFHIQEIRRV